MLSVLLEGIRNAKIQKILLSFQGEHKNSKTGDGSLSLRHINLDGAIRHRLFCTVFHRA